MSTVSSVSGKIILAGEYAVVFGYPGLATPSKERLTVHFTPGKKMEIVWPEVMGTPWIPYMEKIISLIKEKVSVAGTYVVENELPLGKGMGSSTALVIACCRAAIGNGSDKFAREIEDEVNKGHSGIDFAVIARASPILFVKGKLPEPVELPEELTELFELIDTGTPNEPTTELVAWVKERQDELKEPLEVIGACAGRILQGENIKDVIRDHHRAQVALGVVPKETQEIIAGIERNGGAAKVLGAGARTGGGGMVLVLR